MLIPTMMSLGFKEPLKCLEVLSCLRLDFHALVERQLEIKIKFSCRESHLSFCTFGHRDSSCYNEVSQTSINIGEEEMEHPRKSREKPAHPTLMEEFFKPTSKCKQAKNFCTGFVFLCNRISHPTLFQDFKSRNQYLFLPLVHLFQGQGTCVFKNLSRDSDILM